MAVQRPSYILFLWIMLSLSTAYCDEKTLVIGYLELEDDSRYIEERMDARYQAQPWGRPYAGAEVAIKESRFSGSAAGVKFELKRQSVSARGALEPAVKSFNEQGIQLILLDLPADDVSALAKATRDMNVLLFNIGATDNTLRQQQCQPHLMHTAPSDAMLTDALGQFLVSRKWREVLVLKGPKPGDSALLESLEGSAKRFGLELMDAREFVLGRDPRNRSQNNISLLTANEDYDAVIVLDSEGEFARSVPYQTQKPRPVAGSAGLVPDWWHWSFDRFGAPQLNGRFTKHAERPMTGYDWAAWIAVKTIVEAVVRTSSSDFNKLVDYMRGPDIVLDGFKGKRLSYRSWDNQLRQPILLTTYNWVIDSAPFDGFLHTTNNLDTLGADQKDSACAFSKN